MRRTNFENSKAPQSEQRHRRYNWALRPNVRNETSPSAHNCSKKFTFAINEIYVSDIFNIHLPLTFRKIIKMKFWKNIANTLDRRKRQSIASSTNSDGLTNDSPTPSATRRRRSQYSRSVIFLLFASTGYLF